ncbi:hypothetical protein ER308_17785 [Egibacter rhizosphaerae]|uniref:Flagellar FliJ protein n=1 Tax=Egibacter rhizosphaerae TaxID=1670831 RepID=A0A411YIY5_9ACTN|nr:hypothetical protein [Egibacter rhizosphaerae]QBI21238.1 hypothetical protein ER308_17785 [Egibacter rhizosphaerae]
MSRLRTVERVRALLERRALARLVQEQSEVERQAEARRRAEAIYRDRPLPPPELTADRLRALQLQGLGAHELVRDALASEELAEQRRIEVARAWSYASTAHKSVERAAERKEEEAAQEAARAAARALDELALARRVRDEQEGRR